MKKYEEGNIVFCTKCGANNEDGNAFCKNCGAKLVKPALIGLMLVL